MDMRSKLNKIMRETIVSGDYEKFDNTAKKLLTNFPEEGIEALLIECNEDLNDISNFVHETLMELNGEYIKFRDCSSEIYVQALMTSPDEVFEVMKDFIENTEYLRTFGKAINQTKVDFQKGLNQRAIEGLIVHIKQYLNIYFQELEELIAIACVVCNLSHNKTNVEKMKKTKRKEILLKAVKNGDDILLDDKYRHIRNSIAHGSYKILDGQRKIIFIDDYKGNYWKEDYTYEQFVEIVFIPYSWHWATTFSKYTMYAAIFESVLFNQKRLS